MSKRRRKAEANQSMEEVSVQLEPAGDSVAAIRASIRARRLAAQRAERQHVRDLEKPDPVSADGSDLGPRHMFEAGAVELDKGAVLMEDPQDKRSSSRIGARAQRVWAPDGMFRRDVIGPEQWDAAKRIVDDYELGELGARRNSLRGGPSPAPWDRMPYSEHRAIRRESWRLAIRAVPPEMRSSLYWCVLQVTPNPGDPPTVEAWAKSIDWRTERAVGWVAAVLAILARHYGFTRRNTPSVQEAERERAQ